MTKDQLIADIRVTFPTIRAAMREECVSKLSTWMIGGESSAVMPDGLPVFTDCLDAETHDGGVHTGFIMWLESRGWYLERHDEFWFVPTALPTAEELAEYQRRYEEIEARYAIESGGHLHDEVPF